MKYLHESEVLYERTKNGTTEKVNYIDLVQDKIDINELLYGDSLYRGGLYDKYLQGKTFIGLYLYPKGCLFASISSIKLKSSLHSEAILFTISRFSFNDVVSSKLSHMYLR